MSKNNLDLQFQKAIVDIAVNVKDINYKLTHLLENYREDHFVNRLNYNSQL